MKRRPQRGVLPSFPGTFGLGIVGWSLAGCIFFDVEALRCRDDGTCEGVGDGDGDGDGGSSSYPIGGSGGDDDTGGSDGVGGMEAGDGGNGSGGEGNTGGSGGEGTGGTPQVILDLRRDVRINELTDATSKYVELYNRRGDDIDLTGLYVVVEKAGGGYAYPICPLSGGTLPAENVLLVQSGTEECYAGATTCIMDCNLPIAGGAIVHVYHGGGMPPEDYWIRSVTFPVSPPDGGDTHQACPNGMDVFKSSLATPGALNTCN